VEAGDAIQQKRSGFHNVAGQVDAELPNNSAIAKKIGMGEL